MEDARLPLGKAGRGESAGRLLILSKFKIIRIVNKYLLI